MTTPQKLQQLSSAHCVLLAVHYATESNITALRALTALREADLPLELTLSILLSDLPEELDPSSYVEYLNELVTNSRDPGPDPAATIQLSAVEDLPISRVKKRRKALEFVPIIDSLYAAETELDIFSHFLIHRAHRIDAQTGLLDLVPALVVPFLAHSDYLRTWFISTVLPLLRLTYEYYPQSPAGPLDDFAKLSGTRAIQYQLSHVKTMDGTDTSQVARDLKGVVSPWMCGANERKRRKLSSASGRTSITEDTPQDPDDWDCLFSWIMHASKENLPLVAAVFRGWDGPEDMDLGGFEEGRDYVDDDQQCQLEIQYARTAIASLYYVSKNDSSTLQSAHGLLDRICELLNYDPPPDLSTSVEALPSYDLKEPLFRDSKMSSIREDRLLHPDNPITKPGSDSVQMLKLLFTSAVVLSTLQQSLSIQELAKIRLRDDRDEQFSLLHKILHTLSASKKDSDQWSLFRQKILWLWNWGTDSHDDDRKAQGIFGLLDGREVETEILKALIESSHDLAVQIYLPSGTKQPPLPLSTVKQIALKTALHHFDNASNGNRTRGGMKRAYDVLRAFAPHFAKSERFQRAQALLKATHAMSYYSLTLQHGVPFQPVAIRVSGNPLSLIRKLLAQNKGSYTKLDDLIAIGQNLTIAMPSTLLDDDENSKTSLDASITEQKKVTAERRVIGMAIEAALEEDDFETAYSYVVNRLSPPTLLTPSTTPATNSQIFSFSNLSSHPDDEANADDIAWRAALAAGRYNASSPMTNSWTQTSTTARPDLRRLEQRMELLSQALLLAPPQHLEQVLRVWQNCEAEMTTLLAEEADVEQRFNDAADRKLPGTFITDTLTVQPRREIGRGAAEEAPMGLFDVARGAAAAFSKSAFPLNAGARGAAAQRANTGMSESRASMDLSDSGSVNDERVRKRDMVASVASGALNTGTGALASGLGWMLGAKPVQDERQDH